jgi:hypothetical protein
MTRNFFLVLGLLGAAACSSNDRRGSGLGTFSLTWDITAADTHVALNCDDVDAVTLEITSHPLGSGTDIIDDFDCSDFAATTDALPEGDYHVTIDLLDSNDQQLTDGTVDVGIKTIIEDTDLRLGNYVFDF